MSGGTEGTTAEVRRIRERRWWMWVGAVLALICVYQTSWRLSREWDWWTLGSAIVSLALVALVSARFRSRSVRSFLWIAVAVALLTAIRHLV